MNKKRKAPTQNPPTNTKKRKKIISPRPLPPATLVGVDGNPVLLMGTKVERIQQMKDSQVLPVNDVLTVVAQYIPIICCKDKELRYRLVLGDLNIEKGEKDKKSIMCKNIMLYLQKTTPNLLTLYNENKEKWIQVSASNTYNSCPDCYMSRREGWKATKMYFNESGVRNGYSDATCHGYWNAKKEDKGKTKGCRLCPISNSIDFFLRQNIWIQYATDALPNVLSNIESNPMKSEIIQNKMDSFNNQTKSIMTKFKEEDLFSQMEYKDPSVPFRIFLQDPNIPAFFWIVSISGIVSDYLFDLFEGDKYGNSLLSEIIKQCSEGSTYENLLRGLLSRLYQDSSLLAKPLPQIIIKIAIDMTKQKFREENQIGQKEAFTIYSESRDRLDYWGQSTDEVIEAYNFWF